MVEKVKKSISSSKVDNKELFEPLKEGSVTESNMQNRLDTVKWSFCVEKGATENDASTVNFYFVDCQNIHAKPQ
jgi:hypothetical protein